MDTIAKRLMSNQDIRIIAPGQGLAAMQGNLNRVIFKKAHSAGVLAKAGSLFPGLGFAAGYKVLQRVYKFGGQPALLDVLDTHASGAFRSAFGDKAAKPLLHATAGSMIGIGEIVLLPLDVLKIKSQTNPEALRGRGMIKILREENLSNLYKGAGWTAARNAPGSFALFGASALVKDRVFRLESYSDATFLQNFVAASAGGVASITVAAPLDVVKTRLQNQAFDSKDTGVRIVRELIRKEGFGAFFKGLTPKLLVVGPKLIFSFTIAQYMIAKLEHWLA